MSACPHGPLLLPHSLHRPRLALCFARTPQCEVQHPLPQPLPPFPAAPIPLSHFAYAPVPAGLFRMVGYAGSTMVMANSVAMLILLLMVVTNGECKGCRLLQRCGGRCGRASVVPSQAVSSRRCRRRCLCAPPSSPGFSIVRPAIPGYMIWLYWCNPLASGGCGQRAQCRHMRALAH